MMNNREIVDEYLSCFCAGNIEGIEALLASDLSFTGTLHTYHSSEDYLNSLRENPPAKSAYKILSVTENDNSIAVFYEYEKPDQSIKIAQLFKIKDQNIYEILLIFDGRNIT